MDHKIRRIPKGYRVCIRSYACKGAWDARIEEEIKSTKYWSCANPWIDSSRKIKRRSLILLIFIRAILFFYLNKNKFIIKLINLYEFKIFYFHPDFKFEKHILVIMFKQLRINSFY